MIKNYIISFYIFIVEASQPIVDKISLGLKRKKSKKEIQETKPYIIQVLVVMFSLSGIVALLYWVTQSKSKIRKFFYGNMSE